MLNVAEKFNYVNTKIKLNNRIVVAAYRISIILIMVARTNIHRISESKVLCDIKSVISIQPSVNS